MNKKMISVICAAAMAAATMPVMSMTALAADDTIKIGVFEPQTGENGGGASRSFRVRVTRMRSARPSRSMERSTRSSWTRSTTNPIRQRP